MPDPEALLFKVRFYLFLGACFEKPLLRKGQLCRGDTSLMSLRRGQDTLIVTEHPIKNNLFAVWCDDLIYLLNVTLLILTPGSFVSRNSIFS